MDRPNYRIKGSLAVATALLARGSKYADAQRATSRAQQQHRDRERERDKRKRGVLGRFLSWFLRRVNPDTYARKERARSAPALRRLRAIGRGTIRRENGLDLA